jgi:DNA-directed RNA polymerase subunit F
MAVTEETPITLAEVVALAGDSEKAVAIKKFVKNFNKMDVEKAREMKEALRSLDLIKLKEEHIVKIVDFMPSDAAELNKVIIEVSLDGDEVTKILEVVKNFK